MVWTCGADGRRKTTNRDFKWTREGKEKQRESNEDLNGQCQGRPEGEKHQLDQDWRGDQKQRGLEESCKSLIRWSSEKKKKKKAITNEVKRLDLIRN